jgi:hypothetical protein
MTRALAGRPAEGRGPRNRIARRIGRSWAALSSRHGSRRFQLAMRWTKVDKTWRGENSPQLLKPQFISGADIGCNCAKFKLG